VDLDDFGGGFCEEGKYPLINAIKKEYYSSDQTIDADLLINITIINNSTYYNNSSSQINNNYSTQIH
jgi:hypothetical protein